MNPQLFTLRNGLRVLFIDTKAFPTLTTLLLVGAGSRYENKKNNGISHFLEHMFYKGSKNYPSPEIISSAIEGMGGVWNAFTSKDYTGYYVKAANYNFEKVIDILSDVLLRSFLLDREINKEKGVITEEINMYEDQPQSKVGELFENLVYQGTTLGYDVIGTKETVANMTREMFLDYMEELYHPKNAVLIVAGGLSQQLDESVKNFSRVNSSDVASDSNIHSPKIFTSSSLNNRTISYYMSIVEKKFGAWTNDFKQEFKKVGEKQTKPQMMVYYKKTEQAHFCLGFRTFGYFDDRRYALSLLTTILGGGASSRLFIEVREKRGLCYYIGTGNQQYYEVGNMMTQAGVPKDIDKVKEAVSSVIKEHKKIIKKSIKKTELNRAKEMIKGRLLLSMEDSFNVAHYFGKNKLLKDELKTPQEQIKKIDQVTIDNVVDLAKEIFKPDRLNFSIIGPFQEKDFLDIIFV